jgi:3-hydroxybutyryl-CoA dehydratase
MSEIGNSIFKGAHYSLEFTVSDQLMKQYSILSGDINELHVNAEYAKEKNFDGVVVYGGLIISNLSKLIGMYLPGGGSLWNNLKISFMKPLMVNKKAIINAEIIHVSESTSTVEIKFNIISDDEVISRGSAGVSVI